MNVHLPEKEQWFFVILAACVLCTTLLFGLAEWYVNCVLIILFSALYLYTRTWPDRAFYLFCAGIPLAISCGILNIFAGLIVLVMLSGIVCAASGLLESGEDRKQFLYFSILSLAAAVLVGFANHVLLPVLVLCIIGGGAILVQSIRRYRFQKQFTGASP